MTHDIFDVGKSETVSLAKKIKDDKKTRERAVLYASTAVNYFFVIFELYGGYDISRHGSRL